MDENEIRAALLKITGLRVGADTARYVIERLAAGAAVPVAILCEDARTGVPVGDMLSVSALMQADAFDNRTDDEKAQPN